MSTRNKIIVLFFVSVIVLLAALYVFRKTQESQNELILKSAADQQVVLINSAIYVRSNQLDELVTDYSNWDDLIPKLKSPDPKWANDNIASIIESFKLFSVHIYDDSSKLVYCFGNQADDILKAS